jgi:hypothetical protein
MLCSECLNRIAELERLERIHTEERRDQHLIKPPVPYRGLGPFSAPHSFGVVWGGVRDSER